MVILRLDESTTTEVTQKSVDNWLKYGMVSINEKGEYEASESIKTIYKSLKKNK